jgi:hypothetical protein
MTQYLLQLQEDQMMLQTMLEQQRAALSQLGTADGETLNPKELRSVQLMHRAYIYILEDALDMVHSLTEYFERDPQPQ